MASDDRHGSRKYSPFIKVRNDDGTEDVHYSVFHEGLPDEFKTIPKEELNETDENKKKGLRKLRDFLNRENIQDVEDSVLLSVLRNCKYNYKKAETKLRKFLNIRAMIFDKLIKMDVKKIETVLDHMTVGFLPYRDKHGRIIMFTLPSVNFDLFNVDDVTVCYLAVAYCLMALPMSSVCGISYIAECKCSSSFLLYRISKGYVPNILKLMSVPARIGRVDVINEDALVRTCHNILRPFLSTKIAERVSFYGSNFQELQKIYHPDLLPEEFGGSLGPIASFKHKEEYLGFINKLRAEYMMSNNKV